MEEKQRILLCEDDENLGMLLREYLQAKGYYAELCPDGDVGYKTFLKGKFDICVLDVMMPVKDGFTLAQEIRAANSEIPIIFLTAKTLNEDILEGFKIGADDYITKPFSMEVLVSRIEAILRRVCGKKSKENTLYKIGRFQFDTQKQLLTIDDTFRCFDGDTTSHAHFRCDSCGRIVDLKIKSDFLAMVDGLDGFEIKEAQLYLKGICPICKRKN